LKTSIGRGQAALVAAGISPPAQADLIVTHLRQHREVDDA
jgi:hypothetical protein